MKKIINYLKEKCNNLNAAGKFIVIMILLFPTMYLWKPILYIWSATLAVGYGILWYKMSRK